MPGKYLIEGMKSSAKIGKSIKRLVSCLRLGGLNGDQECLLMGYRPFYGVMECFES